MSDEEVLRWRVGVPEHVVLREFPEETVVLNLETGMYHGLNHTAARMLEVVCAAPVVGAAIDALAVEFAQPRERVVADVIGLCRALHERGLIALEEDDGRYAGD